tara:strand:- start:776 stop:4681 length:3906 start_codon:yes stop_codon:yes gene_type:complete
LPQEVELCELLGLSEEDYWFFVDKTESYNGKRSEAYDLIPDIRCDPVSSTFWIQLAIGVALTVVAYLMTPKPKEPKKPPSLKTADQSGVKRFAPQTGFESVQDLAELGTTIPLVFAKRRNVPGTWFTTREMIGGVRVNTKLIWSQLLSLGKGQQLKGIFLVSSGTLGVTASSRPNFAGYAIGDTLLENYTNGKLALYFIRGRHRELFTGRFFKKYDQYNEGTLDDEEDTGYIALPLARSLDPDTGVEESSDLVFSGTRSPSTQVQFGLYEPLPNSMKFMLPYELVLRPVSSKNHNDIDLKRSKIRTRFPRYACVLALNGIQLPGRITVEKGDKIRYTLGDMKVQERYTGFGQWGVEDVKSSVNAVRESADDSIAIGEQFMVGTALAICKNIVQDHLWAEGVYKDFDFEVTEPGVIDVRGITNTHNSFELLIPQKCAVATVSNTKTCTTTEIGIKSTVWKQITGFSNVNSHPGHWQYEYDGTVKKYEEDNGNISLGSINKHIKRLSFFHLFIRKLGSNAEWIKLSNNPFCVTGRTPQPQYNFIRIHHASGQYEFRLVPVPGNEVKRNYENKVVNKLGGTNKEPASLPPEDIPSHSGVAAVYFNGETEYKLEGNQLSNEEWFLGDLPADTGGSVHAFNTYQHGKIPTEQGWVPTGDPSLTSGQQGARNELWIGDDWEKGTKAYWDEGSGESGRWQFLWRNSVLGSVKGPYSETPESLNPQVFLSSGDFRYGISSGVDILSRTDDKQNAGYAAITKYEKGKVDISPTTHTENVTNGTDGNNSLKVDVSTYTRDGVTGYRWKIVDGGTGYETGDTVTIPHANVTVTVFSDSANLITPPWPEAQNLNPYDAISDYITFDAERSSHLNGPEHEITYVNEQIEVNSGEMHYADLALVGLRMNSSKEWTSFSQLSVYIKYGLKVERLISNQGGEATKPNSCATNPYAVTWGGIDCEGKGTTNLFPEIAYALLTDPTIGAGDLVGKKAVDKESMIIAAKFCLANNFYWDGVITENQNLREFIYQQASYCFLDFTIIGGRFALVPAVPYHDNYVMARAEDEEHERAKPVIKALFTDGNTKDLKVSFLSPEERQLFQASVLYRKETENGFAETRVVEGRLSDKEGGSDKDPRETFDLSNFCTRKTHAMQFAKFALRVRQKVDHGIKFQTTPQAAMHLKPGEYFRFYSESTHTSRFANGVITENGTVQSQSIITNGTNIYYWKPGDEEVHGPTPLKLVSGHGYTNIADMTFRGCVFTKAETNKSDRVYKVESITYGEEGFVEIAGSHEPLNSLGALATLDWQQDDFVFIFDPD